MTILTTLIALLLLLPVVEQALRLPPLPAPAPLVQPWGSEVAAEGAAFAARLHLDAHDYLVPDEFRGQWYSAADGVRGTAGQPTRWVNTIYLVGPSTVLDLYTPDSRTIAGQLQRLLPSSRVVNLGISGGGLAAFAARVQAAPLAPGDVVVLYDGVEVARAADDHAAEIIRAAYPLSPCPSLYDASLGIVRALCGWITALSPAEIEQQTATAAARYRQTLATFRASVMQHGAAFVHVLMPYLWSRPLSARERALPWQSANWVAGWQTEERLLADVIDLNLGHALDAERARGVEFYTDNTHLTPAGNALVARALYAYLVRVF